MQAQAVKGRGRAERGLLACGIVAIALGLLALLFGGAMLFASVSAGGHSCGSVMSPTDPSSGGQTTQEVIDGVGAQIKCKRARSQRRDAVWAPGILGVGAFLLGAVLIFQAGQPDE